MTINAFDWVYHDPFHFIFVCVTTGTSFFSNGLLLFIIFTTPATQLGSYRTLLAIFAVCDISTSFMHAVLQPIMYLTSSGFYCLPRHAPLMLFGVSLDTPLLLMFVATYYQTFLIIAYHFVYRYKAVTKMLSNSCTDKWKTWHWITVGVLFYVIFFGAFLFCSSLELIPSDFTRSNAPPEILKLYGKDVTDKNIGFTRKCSATTTELCWHWPSLVSVCLLMCLFGGTAAVICFCIYGTWSIVKSTSTGLSESTREMHQKLFKALLIQTVIPFVVSYIPLTIVILFPIFTGIELGGLGNFLFSITAIFPAIDSFFVLYFIVPFRHAVIRISRLPFKNKISGISTFEEMNSITVTVHISSRVEVQT
ncbi:hypothetical protein PRIPAC_76129 [Pristionchus pacificus]|uniref:G protein-coupled receptor n=1 Tax=Pristionchus pacificus TaxID=54126 RepID=A0A2A6C8I9_PRIPA|nr:hypothetical protein PRIPAC_76129 [Pristionchus pacificus]|eukprot:PDM74416.1 G protein-coupled receptor [Pristionchus pacificus]